MTDPGRDDWTAPVVEEVVAGVHRIPLPLPGDGLRAVNVYALDTDQGPVLVDAGWDTPASRTALASGLACLDHDLGDVRRFLVTHLHRDHVELAVDHRARYASRFALGIGERPGLESLVRLDDESALFPRLRAAGAGGLADLVQRTGAIARGAVDWQLPDAWLADRQVLDLGSRRLEVVATPGHTTGHVVFVDHDAGLLFAGDHVLPHITPSIGFEEAPPESALVDYLASLTLVRALPDLRMLPAHGPLRPTTHDRIDVLLAHHDHRLAQSLAALGRRGATALEVAAALPWTRRDTPFDDLDLLNRLLAVNETIAHLDALVHADRAGVTTDADGVRTYTT